MRVRFPRRRSAILRQLRAAWGDPARHSDRGGDRGALRRLARQRNLGPLLDEQTVRDLLLDDVEPRLDHTVSGLGSQALHWRMRSLPDADDRRAFEVLVRRFSDDADLRERVQLQLSRLDPAPSDGLWRLCQPGQIPFHQWFAVFPLLLAATLGSATAILWWPRALLVLVLLVAVAIGLRTVVYWRTAHILNPLRRLGPTLDVASALLTEAGLGGAQHAALQQAMQSLAPLRPVLRWVGRDPVATGEVAEVAMEYLNLLFLLDANAMYLTARRLRRLHEELFELLVFVGRVDAAQSVASLRARAGGWVVPEVLERGALEIADAWHPLLDAPVPNPVSVTAGHGLLVTGSNMSGKSTYLRTAGLAAALARSINTCPARSYRGPLLTVKSCVQIADDLLAGRSTYLAQAEVAMGMLRQRGAHEPQLFILDEVFRGTNTIERIAAGEAFLRELLLPADGAASPHMAVAATHDGELVTLLTPEYRAVHFGEQVVAGELVFDHGLRAGPANTRSALRLLSLLGAPASLLDAAQARVVALEAERGR